MNPGLPDQAVVAKDDANGIRANTELLRRLSPIEAHALWAETYDRDPNPLLALEERELLPLLPRLKGAFVLDVACGTGRWLARLLGRGARCGAGLDLSPEMLAQARRKPPLQKRLVRADCIAMPFCGEIADLAVCSFAVSYMDDLDGFVRELSRVLRKQGHLFLTDFHPSGYRRGWRRTFRHAGDIVEISNFHYSINHLCAVLRTKGFKLERRLNRSFGEAERSIFEKCGKEHLFERWRHEPAIFIGHFRLCDKYTPEGCKT